MNPSPLLRADLQAALREAIDRTERSRSAAADHEAREKLQQLRVSLEQALTDVQQGREAQVLGLSRWVAGWIPDDAEALISKLDLVERAAIES